MVVCPGYFPKRKLLYGIVESIPQLMGKYLQRDVPLAHVTVVLVLRHTL